MSLVKCRACAHFVSPDAATCPSCGASLPGLSNAQLEFSRKKISLARTRGFAGWLFFGGLIWLGVALSAGADSSAAQWVILFGVLLYVFAEIERNLTERKKK